MKNEVPGENQDQLPDGIFEDDVFSDPDPVEGDAVPYTGGEPAETEVAPEEKVIVERPVPYRSEDDNMFYFKFTIGEERTYGPYKTSSIAESKIKAILEALS